MYRRQVEVRDAVEPAASMTLHGEATAAVKTWISRVRRSLLESGGSAIRWSLKNGLDSVDGLIT